PVNLYSLSFAIVSRIGGAMGHDFSRLRLSDFAKRATAVAAAGGFALQPFAATAATGSIQGHPGKAGWFLHPNNTFQTTSSAWGFSEGSLHTANGTRSDAFDGVLSWHVTAGNPVDEALAGYVSPGGVVDILPSPASLGDTTVAKTVNGNPQTLAGLTVSG